MRSCSGSWEKSWKVLADLRLYQGQPAKGFKEGDRNTIRCKSSSGLELQNGWPDCIEQVGARPVAHRRETLGVMVPEGGEVRSWLIFVPSIELDHVHGDQEIADPFGEVLVEVRLFADPVDVSHVGRAVVFGLNPPREQDACDGPPPMAAVGDSSSSCVRLKRSLTGFVLHCSTNCADRVGDVHFGHGQSAIAPVVLRSTHVLLAGWRTVNVPAHDLFEPLTSIRTDGVGLLEN